MTIKINDIEHELTHEQLEAIREIVPGAFPADGKPLFFVPKKDGQYEYLDEFGEWRRSRWANDVADHSRLVSGNIFRVGHGEKAAAKRRAETACRQWASENGWFKPKDGEERWFVLKSMRGELVPVSAYWQYTPDPIEFLTQKEAVRFLAECGEHLKVWWGMEEKNDD